VALLIPARALRLAIRCTLAVVCSLPWTAPASAQEPNPLEYQVKAAYLLNFARYAEWPPTAFASPTSPITICLFGRDPFGRQLDETLDGRRVSGRLFRVVRSARPAGEVCHVAFLGRASVAIREAWLQALQGEPTLTVGESADFARAGGMIGFVLADETVRFEINVDAVETAGLQISSRVLALATRLYQRGAER
jgi:hypothetical protein